MQHRRPLRRRDVRRTGHPRPLSWRRGRSALPDMTTRSVRLTGADAVTALVARQWGQTGRLFDDLRPYNGLAGDGTMGGNGREGTYDDASRSDRTNRATTG